MDIMGPCISFATGFLVFVNFCLFVCVCVVGRGGMRVYVCEVERKSKEERQECHLVFAPVYYDKAGITVVNAG